MFFTVAVLAGVLGLGAAALLPGLDNGANIGMLALIAAFGVEAVLLALRLRRLDRRTAGLFES